MNLSQFVYKTKNKEGKEILFHSVTRDELPLDASENDLNNFLFFEKHNNEAIEKRLFAPPKSLLFTVLPTMECNLRCSHCCVLHLLKKKDEFSVDTKILKKFLREYFTKFYTTKKINCYFLGGEAFLYLDRIKPIIDVCEEIKKEFSLELIFGTTTNLAFDLTLEHIRLFEKLNTLSVSLDGFESNHNIQRKFLNKTDGSPFHKTVNNIKKLIKCGFGKKIHVQAALNNDLITEEYTMEFTKFLLKLGVCLENTKIGSIFPTKQKPIPSPSWWNHKTKSLFIKSRPCCKHQYMFNIQMNPDGTLWNNYYSQEFSSLGSIHDSIDEIAQKYANLILDHMPSLQDDVCKSCPALGYCWGGCVAGLDVLNKKPSEMCNKEYIIPHIKKLANQGDLIELKKTL